MVVGKRQLNCKQHGRRAYEEDDFTLYENN